MVSYSFFLSHRSPFPPSAGLVGLVFLLSSLGHAPTVAQTLPPVPTSLPSPLSSPTGSLTFGQPLPTAFPNPAVSVPVLPPDSGSLPFQIPPAPPLSTAFSSPSAASILPFTAGPRYLVYVRGNSDLLLEQVRRLEPGAFRRDLADQRVIQAGIFSTEANARDLIAQLSTQGILADLEAVTTEQSNFANIGGSGPVGNSTFGNAGLGTVPALPSGFSAPNPASIPFPGTPTAFNPTAASPLGLNPSAFNAAPANPLGFNPTVTPPPIPVGGVGSLPPLPSPMGGTTIGAPAGVGFPAGVGSAGSVPFTGNSASVVGAAPFTPTAPSAGVGVKSYYVAIPVSSTSLNETYGLLMQANLAGMPPLEQRSSRLGPYLAIGPFADRTMANLAEVQIQAAGIHNARVYYGY